MQLGERSLWFITLARLLALCLRLPRNREGWLGLTVGQVIRLIGASPCANKQPCMVTITLCRFINHACSDASLDPVVVRRRGSLLPAVALFAVKDIQVCSV